MPDLFQARTVTVPLWVIIFWLAVSGVAILTLFMGFPALSFHAAGRLAG
ncbi:MAG TPA: hypothetical protein VJ692_11160 [Nitrospiraceae bacterium]|nr:hypothetical protein [Nitrospiraceae bacterium]